MSYAPQRLLELQAYWRSNGGVSLGIVGDARHVRGYHLGRDRIYSDVGLGDRDYSVQVSCDRDGLTNAASAIDLGKLGGSYDKLRHFSVWLVRQCQSGNALYSQIREIIYSPDGISTLRYDRERGFASAPRTGEAEPHTNHTHISFYRCYEQTDKVQLFKPYFEGGDMLVVMSVEKFAKPIKWTVKAGTILSGYSPSRPGAPIKSVHFDRDSSASADAYVGVEYPSLPRDQWPTPRGYPFLRVVDGIFAGLLIAAAQVTLDDQPNPCQAWIDWLKTAPKE
jgi:hypothetical protein